MRRVSESLFAHINNDPFLVGSYGLQGNSFRTVIGFLRQYLSETFFNASHSGARDRDSYLSREIASLMRACENLESYESKLLDIGLMLPSDNPEPLLADLSASIAREVMALSAEGSSGKYVLMPGGWIDSDGGHMMVYQFHKDENGDLIFSINNAGDGIQYHEKEARADKVLYNPTLSYRIPAEKVNSEQLQYLIKELFTPKLPKVHKRTHIDAKYVYEEVLSNIEAVGGVLMPPTGSTQLFWYTAGQLSGTCTQRSIHQMLKQRFPNVDSYRRFIYGFKMYSLKKYMEETRQLGLIKDKKYHSQIRRAVIHNLRLLRSQKEDGSGNLFSDEKIASDHKELENYLSELTHALEKLAAVSAVCVAIPREKNPAIPIATTVAYSSPQEVTGMPMLVTGVFSEEPIIDRDYAGKDILVYMRELSNACNGYLITHSRIVFETLEHFFNTMPLKDSGHARDVYHFADPQAFYTLFYELQKLYFDSCRYVHGNKTTAGMLVTKFSIFGVLDAVNATHPLSGGVDYLPMAIRIVNGNIASVSRDPFMATNHVVLDRRYGDLQKMYAEVGSEYSGKYAYQYYCSIVSGFPELKLWLIKQYRALTDKDMSMDGALTEGGSSGAALWCFLKKRPINIPSTEANSELLLIQLAQLENKMKTQKQLELAFTYRVSELIYPDRFWIDDRWQSTEPKIVVKEDRQLEVESLFSVGVNRGATYAVLCYWRPTIKSVYGDYEKFPEFELLLRDNCQSLLTNGKDHRDDNLLQFPGVLSSKEDKKTEEEALCGDLQSHIRKQRFPLSLRRLPDYQIPLTIDYFFKQVHLLSDVGQQLYLQANLFEPGLILKHLGNRAEADRILKLLDALIKKGISHFQNKEGMTRECLFLLKLACLVDLYLVEYDPALYGERLKKSLGVLNQAAVENARNPLVLGGINQYRVMVVTQLIHQQREEVDEALLLVALESYFHFQATGNPLETKGGFGSLLLDQTLHRLESILVRGFKNKKINSEMIKLVLQKLGYHVVAVRSSAWSICQVGIRTDSGETEEISVSIAKGKIYKNKLSYAPTPLVIMNHPVCRMFHLKKIESSYQSMDGRVCIIETDEKKYRFSGGATGSYHVQMQLREWGSDWFTLTRPSSEGCGKLLLNDLSLRVDLPYTMTDANHFFWINSAGTEIRITDSSMQVLYIGKKSVGHHVQFVFSDVTTKENICVSENPLSHYFSDFESTHFIETLQSQTDAKNYSLRLPRYGLVFTTHDHGKHFQCAWLGQQYTATVKKDFLGEGVSGILLCREDTEMMMIPVQQFMNTRERSSVSEYYRLKQDLSHEIPRDAIKESDATCREWQLNGAQHYKMFTLRDGVPVAKNAEEALMLCYCYLGVNKPEMAWQVLADCSQRLEGTYEEIKLIQWIMQSLPKEIVEADKKAQIDNPEFVACKLKMLAMLSEFQLKNKPITFPKKPTPDTFNNRYLEKQITEVESFYLSYRNDIQFLYSRMQSMQRDVDAEFSLSDHERLLLLRDYHDALKVIAEDEPVPMGSLGYDWVRLRYQQMQKELHALTQKTVMSEKERQDARALSAAADRDCSVMKRISRLEAVAIDLEKYKHSDRDAGIWDQWREGIVLPEKRLALSALRLDVTESLFSSYFRVLLNIAADNSEGNERDKERLRAFSIAILKKYRNTSTGVGSSKIPKLCFLLYCVSAVENMETEIRKIDSVEFRSLTADQIRKLIDNISQPPPIKVLQLRDSATGVLATARQIWDRARQQKTPQKINSRSYIAIECDRIKSLTEAHWVLGSSLIVNVQPLGAYAKAWDSQQLKMDSEDTAERVDALRQLKLISEESFDVKTVEQLLQQVFTAKQSSQTVCDDLEKLIIAQANKDVLAGGMHVSRAVDMASGKVRKLGLNQLLTLFMHADMSRYSDETGLTEIQIKELHLQIATYVAYRLKHQYLVRAESKLKKCQKIYEESPSDTLLIGRAKFDLAKTLFSTNAVSLLDQPDMAVFQLHSDILYRKRQIVAVEKLTSKDERTDRYPEVVAKILMGEGKSKVLTPTLVQKKANGHNLVMVEVPKALLRTNYADLSAASFQLYGQRAVLFEFSRDSDCSIQALKNLLATFTDVINDKGYIVTSGDCIQSLELKFHELLAFPSDDRVWKEQIKLLGKLLGILRSRADYLVDEAHENLDLKKRLNYTIGSAAPIKRSVVNHSVELYKFLRRIDLNAEYLGLFHGEIATAYDLVSRKQYLVEVHHKEYFSRSVLDALVPKEPVFLGSPLDEVLTRVQVLSKLTPEETRLQIREYLSGNARKIPQCILDAKTEDKEKLAFYMQQISGVLLHTLTLKQGTDYGPSKLPAKTLAHQPLAIPYLANDSPNERSRFGNPLKAVNCTIQSFLISGASRELIRELLEEWLLEASEEIKKTKKTLKADSISGQYFKRWVSDRLDVSFTLDEFDIHDPEKFEKAYALLAHNDDILFDLLKRKILPKIEVDGRVLHSNAINKVEQVFSCQAISGTPYNASSYNPRLRYDARAADSVDEYVFQTIRNKNPNVLGVDYTDYQRYISEVLDAANASGDLRAMIDISASFTGVGNYQIACELTVQIAKRKSAFTPAGINYVLFFNEAGLLCALDIRNLGTTATAEMIPPLIVLGTTDEKTIRDRLPDSDPALRFTYYDQSRILGADVLQGSDARAGVIVDHETKSHDFLQGANRLRELIEGGQKIDVITSRKNAVMGLEALWVKMKQNAKCELQGQNFTAVIESMDNAFRSLVMSQLIALASEVEISVTKMQLLRDEFSHYFEKDEKRDFFSAYGQVQCEKATRHCFEEKRAAVLNDWERLQERLVALRIGSGLRKTTLEYDRAKEAFQRDLLPDVEAACARCAATQKIAQTAGMDLQVETQKQMQIETSFQTEKQQQLEFARGSKSAESHERWLPYWFHDYRRSGEIFPPYRGVGHTKNLSDICRSVPGSCPFNFDPTIQATINFYRTYEGQKNYIDAYAKPVHVLLFQKDLKTGELTCTLVSQEDAKYVFSEFNLLKEKRCSLPVNLWFGTTRHTVLAGDPPHQFTEDPAYQRIIEQVRFFSGDFAEICEETRPQTWLTQDFGKKIEFFEKNLADLRGKSGKELAQLRTRFLSERDLFIGMICHPTLTHTRVDLSGAYADLDESVIDDAMTFQMIFKKMRHSFDTSSQILSDGDSFDTVSPRTRVYLDLAVMQLQYHRRLLALIQEYSMPAFPSYPGKSKIDCLKALIGEALDGFSGVLELDFKDIFKEPNPELAVIAFLKKVRSALSLTACPREITAGILSNALSASPVQWSDIKSIVLSDSNVLTVDELSHLFALSLNESRELLLFHSLLSLNRDINQEAVSHVFTRLAQTGQHDAVSKLLASRNIPSSACLSSNFISAAGAGSVAVIRAILSSRCKLNPDDIKQTFITAVSARHISVFELLLAHPAVDDETKKQAIAVAVKNKSPQILKKIFANADYHKSRALWSVLFGEAKLQAEKEGIASAKRTRAFILLENCRYAGASFHFAASGAIESIAFDKIRYASLTLEVQERIKKYLECLNKSMQGEDADESLLPSCPEEISSCFLADGVNSMSSEMLIYLLGMSDFKPSDESRKEALVSVARKIQQLDDSHDDREKKNWLKVFEKILLKCSESHDEKINTLFRLVSNEHVSRDTLKNILGVYTPEEIKKVLKMGVSRDEVSLVRKITDAYFQRPLLMDVVRAEVKDVALKGHSVAKTRAWIILQDYAASGCGLDYVYSRDGEITGVTPRKTEGFFSFKRSPSLESVEYVKYLSRMMLGKEVRAVPVLPNKDGELGKVMGAYEVAELSVSRKVDSAFKK